MNFLRAYALKVDEHLTDKVFEKFRFAFPSAELGTLKAVQRRIASLSGFRTTRYDCCVNSCVCFTGPYENLDTCPNPKCGEARRNQQGCPRKQFEYLPLIPRLKALAASTTYSTAMRYRAHDHAPEPGVTKDIFDGTHYRNLKGKQVHIDDKPIPAWFFNDPRDIALGLSTDGFGPFKHRTQTSWPIIIFNYNLPPDVRFHLRNIISVGNIPGPRKPWDADSFLYPLIQEAIQLEIGVTAFDALSQSIFLLRAFLIAVFGDIPAVSMLMRIKGHNALCPCRMCTILGVRGPSARSTTHYVPLNREKFPASAHLSGAPTSYDPSNLPLRTHDEFISQAREVQSASMDASRDRLAKRYGIKGVPLLSLLSSLSFPLSFPYDFMHLILENLIPNLILLWTGSFKDLGKLDVESGQPYILAPSVWDAIGAASAAAGDTIPGAFGSRVPNVADQKSQFTAETRSLWTLFLAPTLLMKRFKNERVYKHFVQLVRLLNLCLQFEITDTEVKEVRTGFIRWVEEYERYVLSFYCLNCRTHVQARIYYRYEPGRASACPLTIHALLHIADSIKAMGPVWATWAFPMERYCGSLLPGIRNRRYPYASINKFMIERAHLTQIKLLYDLHQDLSLEKPPGNSEVKFSPCEYQLNLSSIRLGVLTSGSQIHSPPYYRPAFKKTFRCITVTR